MNIVSGNHKLKVENYLVNNIRTYSIMVLFYFKKAIKLLELRESPSKEKDFINTVVQHCTWYKYLGT